MPTMYIHLQDGPTVTVTTSDTAEIASLVALYLDSGHCCMTIDNDDTHDLQSAAGARVPANETGRPTVPDEVADSYWRAEMRWERRHQAEADYDSILGVSCSFCHATAAQPCATHSGRVQARPYVHADRRASWHRLVELAVDRHPSKVVTISDDAAENVERANNLPDWLNRPVTLDEMKDYD